MNSSARAPIPGMLPLQQQTRSLPISLHGGRAAAFAFQIEAARKKKSARKEGVDVICPVKPPSLFVKRSPVPARRPLRGVPFVTGLDLAAPQRSAQPSSDFSHGESSYSIEEQAFPAKESKVDKVSKWASLFEAASTTRSSSSSESQDSAKDADAWFDKIFPKNTSAAKEGDSLVAAPPKLSAQQEKSIQQLQTLVKTLGVATRSAAPPARRNKPGSNKIRQLPVQGGGVVDPVPFSSILKKLQSVSVAAPAPPRLEESIAKAGEDDEDEDLEDEDEETSEEETEEEESEDEARGGIQEQAGSSEIAAENEDREQVTPRIEIEDEDLAKLTVVGLRAKAKARGLSGYSKMKKGELVQLLRS